MWFWWDDLHHGTLIWPIRSHTSLLPLVGSEWTWLKARPISANDMKLNYRAATLFPMDLNLRGCWEGIQSSEETRIKQKEKPRHFMVWAQNSWCALEISVTWAIKSHYFAYAVLCYDRKNVVLECWNPSTHV